MVRQLLILSFSIFLIPIPVTFPPLEMSITIIDVEWWIVDQPADERKQLEKIITHQKENINLKKSQILFSFYKP